MNTLRTKWEKALRVRQQIRQTKHFVARARKSGLHASPILVTNLAQLGDIVMCAGVAAALREQYPGSPLIFACRPEWASLLETDPLFDGVLGMRSLYEVRALARQNIFSTIFVLDIPIPDLLNYLDKVPAIYRYAPPTTKDWFKHGKHLMALYEQNAGIPEGTAKPRVSISDKERCDARNWLAKHGLSQNKPIIALHTHSSEATKNWPPEKFLIIIEKWRSRYDAQFVIVGGPDEGDSYTALENVVIIAAGKLSLRQTAAVIGECDYFVGLDSGLAYIAEALEIPGLIILGATVAETCGPRNHNLFSFVRPQEACLPACHRVCTQTPYCIEALDVTQVDRAFQRVWEQKFMQERLCMSR